MFARLLRMRSCFSSDIDIDDSARNSTQRHATARNGTQWHSTALNGTHLAHVGGGRGLVLERVAVVVARHQKLEKLGPRSDGGVGRRVGILGQHGRRALLVAGEREGGGGGLNLGLDVRS